MSDDAIPPEWERGMAIAAALMAAGYGGDSGEDVDRFIEMLYQRGYEITAIASPSEEPGLDDRTSPLRRAIDGFRWLGNNLHNAGKPEFEEFYLACLEDMRVALGDDWQPARLAKEPGS
jgi:hypothetical protein